MNVEYAVYSENDQPNRLEFRRGQRYLLEIFDGSDDLRETLPALLEMALSPPPGAGAPASLGRTEKFLGFLYGRVVQWAGDARALPERAKSVAVAGIHASRESTWRVLRLKGWGAPRILFLNRTDVRGGSPAGSQHKTTFHPFVVTLEEARLLRDGLQQVSTMRPGR